MSQKLPWMKFYPSDWLSDEGLRSCSVAARGLWMDLIALMSKSNTHGYLLIGGMPPSVEKISKIVGEDVGVTRGLLEELESHHVFSRDEDNVVFSRRMRRDEEKRKLNIDRVARHRQKHESDIIPTKEQWMEYAKTIKGWETRDAESSFDYYQSNGWRVGGKTLVRDWRACARNCFRRSAPASPSVGGPKPSALKMAPKSSCESPPVKPLQYDSVDGVCSMIRTAIREGTSLAFLEASTPKNVWEKAMAIVNGGASCPR